MTPRPALLALMFFAPVRALAADPISVSPASCPCPQNAADAARLLQDLLLRYGIPSPPDLSSEGLELSPGGGYKVKEGDDGGGLFATRKRLAASIERRLLAALGQGAGRDVQRWVDAELRARFPGQAEELGALSTQGKAVLLQFIINNPVVSGDLKTLPRGFSARLNSAAGGEEAATALAEMFDFTPGQTSWEPKVYGGILKDPLSIHVEKGEARDPADRFSSAVRKGEILTKGFKPQAPTLRTPAPPSLLFARLGVSTPVELGELLRGLKDRPDAEIAALRAELLTLVTFEDEEVREKALYLLGRLHDPSLASVFHEALNDESSGVRDTAVMGLWSGLGVIGLQEGFDGIVRKGPEVLSLLVSGKEQRSLSQPGNSVRRTLGFLNLMDAGQKKDFIAGFDDPAALAVVLSMTRGDDVNEREGTHSPEGKALFLRVKDLALARGKPLSLLLKDPAISPEARDRFFSRANRYDVLKDAVKEDPQLVAAAIESSFGVRGAVGEETFSVFKTMSGALGEKFYGIFLAASATMDARTKAHALLFLKADESAIPPRPRKELQAALARFIPEDLWGKVPEADVLAPYDRVWPTGTLTAYVAMTQPEWAAEFSKALQAAGYVRREEFWIKKTAKRQVRLLLKTFDGGLYGWAQDKEKLTKSLVDAYTDERFQVVVYRGHTGDYDGARIAKASSRNKVFIDLACDSDSGRNIVSNCEGCEFFGTLTKSEGAINDRFLLSVLESLALGETHGQTRKRLVKDLPLTYHKFTGDWSPMTRYVQYMQALDGT